MQFDYAGSWKNQLGATMSVKVEANGIVTGWYKSPASPTKADLSGFSRNGFLVFSVAFENSAGTMLGQPSPDGKTFDTWWHFRMFKDPSPEWATVRTGCDTFERD